jgi:hypothetical protein
MQLKHKKYQIQIFSSFRMWSASLQRATEVSRSSVGSASLNTQTLALPDIELTNPGFAWHLIVCVCTVPDTRNKRNEVTSHPVIGGLMSCLTNCNPCWIKSYRIYTNHIACLEIFLTNHIPCLGSNPSWLKFLRCEDFMWPQAFSSFKPSRPSLKVMCMSDLRPSQAFSACHINDRVMKWMGLLSEEINVRNGNHTWRFLSNPRTEQKFTKYSATSLLCNLFEAWKILLPFFYFLLLFFVHLNWIGKPVSESSYFVYRHNAWKLLWKLLYVFIYFLHNNYALDSVYSCRLGYSD